jgi:hypothetical protein
MQLFSAHSCLIFVEKIIMKAKTKICLNAMIFSVALITQMCLNIKKGDAQIQDASSKLKFVDVSERLKTVDRSLAVVIVSWNEWGRKKKGCKGFGLCDPTWFPEVQEMPVGNASGSIVELDKNSGKYYFDILLAESLPSEISGADLIFEIDENILLETNSVTGKNLTIQSGQYLLDASMGRFGGYRIAMQ